jgi:hypothetical protein
MVLSNYIHESKMAETFIENGIFDATFTSIINI